MDLEHYRSYHLWRNLLGCKVFSSTETKMNWTIDSLSGFLGFEQLDLKVGLRTRPLLAILQTL